MKPTQHKLRQPTRFTYWAALPLHVGDCQAVGSLSTYLWAATVSARGRSSAWGLNIPGPFWVRGLRQHVCLNISLPTFLYPISSPRCLKAGSPADNREELLPSHHISKMCTRKCHQASTSYSLPKPYGTIISLVYLLLCPTIHCRDRSRAGHLRAPYSLRDMQTL